MQIYHRPFDDRTQCDFHRMWLFLVEDYAQKQGRFIWSTGRLGDWNYGLWSVKKYFPSFRRKNAHLWLNNYEDVVGFVVSENCDAGFAVFAQAGMEYLYSEMIQWVKANWGSREGHLSTEVHEHDTAYAAALEAQGLSNHGLVMVTYGYDLNPNANGTCFYSASSAGRNLPPGFVISDMHSHPDYLGKTVLTMNAFERNDGGVTELDLLRYEYARENPAYRPQFDLCVVDEETGAYVSTCTAFIDFHNSYAEIEKVCTHSEYRRRGLAEAVIRECIERLRAAGIRRAYISGYGEGPKRIYAKMGVPEVRNWFIYRLGDRDAGLA